MTITDETPDRDLPNLPDDEEGECRERARPRRKRAGLLGALLSRQPRGPDDEDEDGQAGKRRNAVNRKPALGKVTPGAPTNYDNYLAADAYYENQIRNTRVTAGDGRILPVI